MVSNPAVSPLLRFASGLRFPWLFALALTLFLLDLIIPDFVPFADEVLLGLVTLMLGSFRRKQGRAPQAPEKGEVIDVTPESGDD